MNEELKNIDLEAYDQVDLQDEDPRYRAIFRAGNPYLINRVLPRTLRGIILRTMAEQRSQRLVDRGYPLDLVLLLMNRWVERMNTPAQDVMPEDPREMTPSNIEKVFPAFPYGSRPQKKNKNSDKNGREVQNVPMDDGGKDDTKTLTTTTTNDNVMSAAACTTNTDTSTTTTVNNTHHNIESCGPDAATGITATYNNINTTTSTATTVSGGKRKRSNTIDDEKHHIHLLPNTNTTTTTNPEPSATANSLVNKNGQKNDDSDNNKKGELECCCVCLLDFELGVMVRTLACKHTIHRDCVDEWLKVTPRCPLCRMNMRRPSRLEDAHWI